MLNKFSHIIFNSSIVIPYILALGVSSIISNRILLGGIWISTSIILIILQIIFIIYIRNNLQAFKINVTNINDDSNNWYLVSFISYFSPFLENLLKKEIDNYAGILMLIAVVLIVLGKKTANNPILKIIGYNSYKISTEQGKEFTLLSKKNIRNSKDVKKVLRIFEDILMEV